MSLPFFRPTIVEVDLDAITHNIEFIKRKIPNNAEIMAVVKADAYGHGAIPIVKHLQSLGIRYYAVAFLDEAIQLRYAGIEDPILVLGYTPNKGIEEAIRNDITLTVFTKETIDYIHLIGERLQKKLKVHIKIDTGMGRIGLFPEDLLDFINYINQNPWIKLEGIYTHFATADEKDKTFTMQQYEKFIKTLNETNMINRIPFIHVSNSAAIIDLPELSQSMVRLGISLYGLLPSNEVSISTSELKPAMSVKTEVVYVKKLKSGQTVSYGATFKAERETIVATIPIGYADGLLRGLSNAGYVLIHGQKAPIIGMICMDQTMVDVTDIPDVRIGDEVVIIGAQGDQYILANHQAEMLNTINYEIVTIIGKRIPRVYRKNGDIVEIVNGLIE
ncbi:alanine racemase [Vulcanibacillus modesticaldus]|uniref:Alanine racemase n=1 Tax=Vulcanibacillus modesticaldus TaxID=337097 RepID=A0A1D2YWW3_9BACI|nr:alanine racemase [Vulcanibacillus modesticaldus]OEG00251.1 alanine racemase [Vulcanibacillus modesticaldus]